MTTLPIELWRKILNYKRRMDHDDRWGWRKEIDLSKGVMLYDWDRWWVGNHRLPLANEWPDLDRAWFIYYLKYYNSNLINDVDWRDRRLSAQAGIPGLSNFNTVPLYIWLSPHPRHQTCRPVCNSPLGERDYLYNQFNNRYAILDQIDPARHERRCEKQIML